MTPNPWEVERQRLIAALGTAALLAVGFVAYVAHAVKPPQTEHVLLLTLNGVPTKVGTLVSGAGGSITNAATATPFTVTSGKVYMVECTVAANVGMGATAHATASNANYLPKVNAAPDRTFLVANGTSMVMVPSAGAAGDCAVFEMVAPP